MLSFALRSSLLPNASTGSHTSASYPFLCDVTRIDDRCDVITGRSQQRERHPFCSLGVRENNLLVRDLRPWPGIVFSCSAKRSIYLSTKRWMGEGKAGVLIQLQFSSRRTTMAELNERTNHVISELLSTENVCNVTNGGCL